MHVIIVALLSMLLTFSFWFLSRDTIGIAGNEFFVYQNNPFESSGKIVIVRVDNDTLDALQKTDMRVLNLSKTVFADAIEKLNAAWTKAIWIDIVFANRAEDEWVLRDALTKHQNVVIGAKVGWDGDSERILPLDTFSGSTWGMIDIPRYGTTLSRMLPVANIDGSPIETMSIALSRKFTGGSPMKQRWTDESFKLTPLTDIPLENRMMLIPFFHEAEGYPSYSLIDVLEWDFPEGAFSWKIVLIGEHGTLIHDAFPAPINREKDMPWVEFHANMLDGILTETFIDEKDTAWIALILIVVLSGIFFILRVRWNVLVWMLVLWLLVILARILFTLEGAFYDLMLLFEWVTITFIVSALYKHFVTEKEKRFIEHAFGHYISPDVVKNISANPKNLKLGGEKREITVLFSDIAGFTTLSETLWTERLFEVVGEYLSEMTDILTHHHGTLDKYIWDAVMGFFGAPLSMPDGSERACRAALEQQARLNVLMKKWESDGVPTFSARIGIHTGEAMVGNIGSKKRFNYTVMGDTVNLASRLEGVNKEYGTDICVSEAVVREVGDIFEFRELDTIRVKWKNEWVKIFELLGAKWTKEKKHENYESALASYYLGDYSKAKELFDLYKTEDEASQVLSERCSELIKSGETLEWGIWTMTSK